MSICGAQMTVGGGGGAPRAPPPPPTQGPLSRE